MQQRITFFARQEDFRKWLHKNHLKEKELLVGFYKVGSGKPSMTWSESVDQALCYGWIDGIRRSVDGSSYSIRFTPRRPTSIWSTVNIKKVGELTRLGLMQEAGLAIFEKRKDSKSRVYAYENATFEFSTEFAQQFMANKKGWQYFKEQAPSYRKVVTKWVMSAVQEATRRRRMNLLIADCAAGNKVKPLSYGPKKKG